MLYGVLVVVLVRVVVETCYSEGEVRFSCSCFALLLTYVLLPAVISILSSEDEDEYPDARVIFTDEDEEPQPQ